MALEIERNVDRSLNVDSDFNIDDLIIESETPKVNKIDYPLESPVSNEDQDVTPTPFRIPYTNEQSNPITNFNMFANSNNVKKNISHEEDRDSDRYRDRDSDSEKSRRSSIMSVKSERMSEDAIRKEKVYLLFKLKNYEKRGHDIAIRVSMDMPLQDLRNEVARLKKKTEVEQSQKLLRSMTLAGSGFLEWANNKYDPVDADLDGWTESMQINIDNFDDVFEELHEKYSDKISVPPEVKLVGMFGMSAFMFAWSKRQLKAQKEMNSQTINNDISSAINNLQKMSGGASMSGPDNIEDVLAKLNTNEIQDTSSESEASEASETRKIKVTKKGRPRKHT